MNENDAQHRTDRSRREVRPAFDLYISKLHHPVMRPGTIRRSSLIRRLAGNPCPVVSVVAPSGYGKTTLLSEWAEASGRDLAWVSVDQGDNDPKVLLAYIAAALDAVEPIDGRVFDALASPVSSVPGSVIPRLGSALWSMSCPVMLVLDDVHLLENRESQAALSALADHVHAGSQLVLAGRARPPLQVARLRAQGRIAEIGPEDLSLTRQEAASLLRDAGVALDDAEVAQLHQRTEGWAAGLYLAALYLREGGSVGRAAVSFGGDDRLEYFMAAADADTAAELVEKLWHPAYRQGRITTVQRWFRWLDERGGIEGHPLAAVFASLTAGAIGQLGEAERWADVVDRWQGAEARPDNPAAEAWGALLRAWMCRRGVEQMGADAAEAARRVAALGILTPGPPLLEGIACLLCGDPDGGDTRFADAMSVADAGPRSIYADRCRTACAASAIHAPVVPRDRR